MTAEKSEAKTPMKTRPVVSKTEKPVKVEKKEEKPPTECEAMFTWNGWIKAGALVKNPDFPFKHKDRLVVRLVPSATGHNLVVSKAEAK